VSGADADVEDVASPSAVAVGRGRGGRLGTSTRGKRNSLLPMPKGRSLSGIGVDKKTGVRSGVGKEGEEKRWRV